MEMNNEEVNELKKNAALEFLDSIGKDSLLDDMQLSRLDKSLKELDELDPPSFEFDAEAMLLDLKTNYYPNVMLKKDEISKLRAEKLNDLVKRTQKSKQVYKILAFAASLIFVLFIFNYKTIAEFKWAQPIRQWSNGILSRLIDKETQNPQILKDGLKQYTNFKYIESDYSIELLTFKISGYKLEFINVLENMQGDYIKIQAIYNKNDQVLQYTIEPVDIKNQWTETVEDIINEDNVEEYNYNNITYYIFENNNWVKVSWNYKNFNYNLTGNMTNDELYKILRSIK